MSTQKSVGIPKPADLSVLGRGNRIVGAKQIRKAVSAGDAQQVFLAENADPNITEPIESLCKEHDVCCFWVSSMKELGRACGIDVGAAAAALI